MRPRPEGRGEPSRPAARLISFDKLQCGHDPKAVENRAGLASTPTNCCFNAATTRRPWRTTRRTVPARPGRPGFNAATTRRPWRTQAPPKVERYRHPLQCGHDPKAVENEFFGWLTGVKHVASMRPRPEGRGERRGRRRAAGAFPGFNAATTRRPWRTKAYSSYHAMARRFNAATTRRPWRTVQVHALRLDVDERFNAATTRRPWRTRCPAG